MVSETDLLPQHFHSLLQKGSLTTKVLEQKQLKVEIVCYYEYFERFSVCLENYSVT